MPRPALEVADIFRDHGAAWRRANAGHVSLDQMKVMSAIERCRTVALGGHVARCENCADCPELADDERFSTLTRRTDNVGELYEIVIERMRGRTTAEWRQQLDAFDVPNGLVTDLEGLLADSYLAETRFFERVEHPSEGKMLTTAIPVAFSNSPGNNFRLAPPRLGEHTRSVLGELGYSGAQIDAINL